MLNRSLVKAALAGIVLFGAADAVRADTITQIFNVPNQQASFTAPYTFNLFDTNLGTLTDISVELATTTTASLTVANLSLFGSTGPLTFDNGSADVIMSVTGPPGSTLLLPAVHVTSIVPTGTTLALDTIQTFPGTTVTNDTGPLSIAPALFGGFEASGGGSVTDGLNFSADAGSIFANGDPLLFYSASGEASGQLTLVYTYTAPQPPVATPEPGTWALVFASASVSVAGLRKRRALKK